MRQFAVTDQTNETVGIYNCREAVVVSSERHGADQGSSPAGTSGNGVPKVILTVGTAFPGTQ